MKIRRLISLILTIAISHASATRADELSDLVADVVRSVAAHDLPKDTARVVLPTDTLPSAPDATPEDLDISLLDRIYRAMKRQRADQMYLEASGGGATYEYDNPWGKQRPPLPSLEQAQFFRPVPGRITSDFGWRQQFRREHHGVDLSLNLGDTVRVALSGTVEKTAYDHDGYGHYVVVSHPDGMTTIYGHLQAPLVSEGEFLHSGQPLGLGGSTGNSTGPHLHFEVRVNDVEIDPTFLFDLLAPPALMADAEPAPQSQQGPVYTHQAKSLARESTYIVRYGDTLQSIARQAGISVLRLCQLNMLQESAQLEIGRMLKIR